MTKSYSAAPTTEAAQPPTSLPPLGLRYHLYNAFTYLLLSSIPFYMFMRWYTYVVDPSLVCELGSQCPAITDRVFAFAAIVLSFPRPLLKEPKLCRRAIRERYFRGRWAIVTNDLIPVIALFVVLIGGYLLPSDYGCAVGSGRLVA